MTGEEKFLLVKVTAKTNWESLWSPKACLGMEGTERKAKPRDAETESLPAAQYDTSAAGSKGGEQLRQQKAHGPMRDRTLGTHLLSACELLALYFQNVFDFPSP